MAFKIATYVRLTEVKMAETTLMQGKFSKMWEPFGITNHIRKYRLKFTVGKEKLRIPSNANKDVLDIIKKLA